MRRVNGIGILAVIAMTAALVSGCQRKAPETTTAATQPQEAVVAFTHVTVIDATGAPAKPDQTVVIAGNRIRALGPASEVQVPAGARVVEARGKYLIPGLWDLHVHLHFATSEVLPVFVAHGVTGIRELNTGMAEIQEMRAAGQAGSLLVPRIVASGHMIEAGEVEDIIKRIAPPVIRDYATRDRVFVDTPEEARQAVRTLAALEPDLLKQHVSLKRDVYFAVLDEAHRVGLSVAGHYPMGEKVTFREIIDAGQRSIEHVDWHGAPAEFAALDPAQQQDLIARMKERDVTFVPTLVTYAAEKSFLAGKGGADTPAARLERAHGDPRARYITPYMWQAWDALLTVDDGAKKEAAIPEFDREGDMELLRKFQKSGVPVLPGTDFTVQFVFPGSSLHEELIELVKQIGMTPHEALQAATRQSAELVGLQDQLGTVQPGKIADLVLLDADPLADIANTQRISAVVREGRLFDRHALDETLDQAASKLQQLKPPAPTKE